MEAANIGPRVTQYTLVPQSGVKLSRIENLSDNIALNLAAESIRVEAPIPGKRAVGVEIPNLKSADVRLFGVLDSKEWRNARDPLTFAIGKDIAGHPVVGNLSKMPHLLIAGQTGSGKSVMMNALLTSLLYRHSPSELKLIMVDPKVVEMTAYEDIPHLLTPIINDSEKALSALKWAVNEMERRYRVLADEKMIEKALAVGKTRQGFHTFLGRVATGDCFVSSQEKKAFLRKEFQASCCEMEGAAIAQIAKKNGVPFLILRFISDEANTKAPMTYTEFERKAIAQSVDFVLEFLK